MKFKKTTIIFFLTLSASVFCMSSERVCASDYDASMLEIKRPYVFRRMDKNAHLEVVFTNNTGQPLERIAANIYMEDEKSKSILIDLMKPKDEQVFRVPVNTELRPGSYTYRIVVQENDRQMQVLSDRSVTINIVARPAPLKMPVIMWGHADLKQVQEAGFTHSFVTLVDNKKMWYGEHTIKKSDHEEQYEKKAKILDQALLNGFGVIGYIGAGHYLNKSQGLFLRVDRSGKQYAGARNICGLFPEVKTFSYNVGASIAKTYGQFPAFEGAIVESETRGATHLCFHKHDLEAFRQYTGYEMPHDLPGKLGLNYSDIKNFPPNRIVNDDDPTLVYLKWFWQKGDGWNAFYTQMHQGLNSTSRNDIWTWYDPAVRVPSVSGSGGETDFISQWTYSYPDPIKIGKATDELLAMADLSANKNQGVLKTTQAIWYRSETAPKQKQEKGKLTEWEKTKSDAKYITISPDHLREAFWSKISRPIQGVMYHGWWSLLDVNQDNVYQYRYTNSQTQHVLKELIDTVVTPLGPTLLQVPDRKSDVAFLQSFSSEMFGGVAELGWGWGWSNDAYQILRYAQLQPKVIYDETILRDGLDGFKVLVLVKCPVLTRSVADAIIAFQDQGGIIIGDENLAPGISPDIVLESNLHTDTPDTKKTSLQAKAVDLSRELASVYKPYAKSNNLDVLVRVRHYKTTDYLFAVNDKRTYGDYVGQYRKIMEKGLKAGATLTLNRSHAYVYDLVSHAQGDAVSKNGNIRIKSQLDPGGGRLYMLTSEEISNISIDAKPQTTQGQSFVFHIAVTDEKDHPIQAVVPVEVTILDPQGNHTEFSGYYGAKDGQLTLRLDMASNDMAGQWLIKAEELASGKKIQRAFKLVTP